MSEQDVPQMFDAQPSGTVRKRSGAPVGNRNALTSGARSWWTTGRLPKGCSHVRRQLRLMINQLTAKVVEVHGECDLERSSLIHSASRHEGAAILAGRWLRELQDRATDEKPLDVALSLAVLREIRSATDARDKAIKALDISPNQNGTIFDQLYSLQASGEPADTRDDANPTNEATNDG